MNRHLLLVSTVAMLVCSDSSVYATQTSAPTLQEVAGLLTVLNDIHAPWEERLAAESRLLEADDPQSIPLLFSIIDTPVPASSAGGFTWPGDPEGVATAADVLAGSTGSPRAEWDHDRPPGVQIVWARKRVWDHWIQSLGQPEARANVIAQLLHQPTTEFQFRCLLKATRYNWNEDIERWMLAALADPRRECSTRLAVGNMIHHRVRFDEVAYAHLRDAVNAVAWQERAGPCADTLPNLADPRRGDPRAMVIMIERYRVARARGQDGAAEALRLASALEWGSGRRTDRWPLTVIDRALQGDAAARGEAFEQTDAWIKQNERALRARAEAMP